MRDACGERSSRPAEAAAEALSIPITRFKSVQLRRLRVKRRMCKAQGVLRQVLRQQLSMPALKKTTFCYRSAGPGWCGQFAQPVELSLQQAWVVAVTPSLAIIEVEDSREVPRSLGRGSTL